MNEQIQKLIEQATIRGEEYRPGDDGHPTPTFYFDKEKFAELIVKDCMTMCVNEKNDYIKHRKAAFDFVDKNIYAEGEAACDTLRIKMKLHFGVEE